MLPGNRFLVLGGAANHEFDARVLRIINQAFGLNLDFSFIWHNTFPDQEPGFSLEDYKDIPEKHVIMFSCPINDAFFLEMRDQIIACKQQYHAASITLVLSFLIFRRQDHDDKNDEITRLRWLMRDLKHWGVDHLIVCEPHNVQKTIQFANEFGLSLYIANPRRLFAKAVTPLIETLDSENVIVYSPDFGSVGRSLEMANLLNVRVLASPKLRTESGIELVEDETFLARIQEVYGATVPISCDINESRGLHLFMQEDELATGRTSEGTAKRLRDQGAASVRLLVTHPVCTHGWKTTLFPRRRPQPFDGIWIGNTRPRGTNQTEYQGSTDRRIHKVHVEPAIAETLIKVLETIQD